MAQSLSLGPCPGGGGGGSRLDFLTCVSCVCVVCCFSIFPPIFFFFFQFFPLPVSEVRRHLICVRRSGSLRLRPGATKDCRCCLPAAITTEMLRQNVTPSSPLLSLSLSLFFSLSLSLLLSIFLNFHAGKNSPRKFSIQFVNL